MSEKPSTSLYRRHRPQSFDEVVGQEHVVTTLRNAVESDRVHHAYLFVGSRGTGKTSMAKILARSLNCSRGPTATPCGECDACRAIAAGSSLDVVEMDAASNRSVDDIRDLRDRVGYAPAEGSWKVYILDEAHMLTKEAWNAFLKTLEEPPPNTVFVLATTEPQKVMATIADRCQRFDFQRPTAEQVAEVVERVAASEGISIDAPAVSLVSRAASGSFRDALGTLDQLVSFGGETVTAESVAELLGAADAELLFEVTDALIAQDPAACLEAVERLSRSGRDPSRFASDLVAHLRQLLVSKATGEVPEAFTVTASDPERLMEQASRSGEASLVGAIDVLVEATGAIRAGDDPRFSLEVALLRLADPRVDPSREALVRRVEELEARLAGKPAPEASADAVEAAPPERPVDPPASEEEAPTRPAEADTDSAEPSASIPAASVTVEASELELERVIELWPSVVERVRDSGSQMLSSLVHSSKPVAIEAEGSVLRVGFPADATFNKRKVETEPHAERVAAAVTAVLGVELRLTYELLEEADEESQRPSGQEGASTEGDPEADPAETERKVEMIKQRFDAEEVPAGKGDEAPAGAEADEEAAS